MGGHAPHGQHNASDARFVACPGKGEGRKEAERPPALQSVGNPAVLLSVSYPCARQSAIRRCRTLPSPLPPCLDPVHVGWGLPARATRFTTHSPTLRTGFIADDTPKSRKRLPRPSSESVGLQSSSAGVRSQALVLLGSMHVELSSRRCGNHPPSSNSRHHRYRWIGWRSRSFYPPPNKNKTHGSHPPLQQCAPSPVLEQVDGRPRPVFGGIGGRPPIPGFEPAPSRRAPGALPPGWLPSEIHWHPGHRTNAPATPSPCAKSKPAVRVLCWAMNRKIGAPLQPGSPQPPHASRRAKLRAHRARHGNPADRRLDTKSTPLSPPTGTERGPHNRTPAPTMQTPTAHPVDGQSGDEKRKTPNAPRNGRRHPPGDALPPPPQPQAK